MAGTGASSRKVFLPSSLTLPVATPKTIPSSVGAPGSSGPFNLVDDQKRWLVTGICLNKILLPTLRDFVKQEMPRHYTVLITNHNIDKQTYPGQLTKDGKCSSLNYGSINNNEATHKKKIQRYDYNVKSEVDLAKLYLQSFMAKFTGFDDTCDLSAVLGILSSASVFSSALQGLASDVRKDVRNEWGHCNFGHWNGTKFAKCFQLMDSLVRALTLSPAEEKRVTDELQDWETKGLQICISNIVDADLVKFIEVEVAQLSEKVKLLEKSQVDEALRVSNALQSVQDAIEEYNQEIKKALESLKESQENLSQRVNELDEDRSAIARDLGSLRDVQQNLTTEVDSIKKDQDALTRRVDEGEEKYASLDKRVEALETAIETKSCQQTVITFQAPKRIPCFHGRLEELEILAKPLEKKTAPCSMTAVYGLGGTGKTSLAIEHIWSKKDIYNGGVFWISGETNTLFDLSMTEMARQIGTFDEDFQKTLSKTITWLQQRKEYWCLVVDNLDELDLSTEMLKLLCGHWKRQATGHILITTRREKNLLEEEISDLSEENCIALKNLSEAESVEFMKKRTGRTDAIGDDVIRELVVEMGTLPLALDQAAAFIKNRKEISFSQYLDQYKEQKLKVLKRSKAYYPAQDTSNDRIAVQTTWQLNFDYVSRQSEEYGIGQAATLVMEVSAFLSPDDIPEEIINKGLPHVNKEDFLSCVSTSFGVTDIMSVLTKFSLFQTFTDKSYSVHRLVQEVIRSRISQDHLKHVLLSACRMLRYAFANTRSPVEVCKDFKGDSVFSQDNPPSLHLWGKLGAHASVLQKYVIQNSKKDEVFRLEVLYTEEAAILLNETSLYLSVCRQKVEAMELQACKLTVMTHLEELPKETLEHLKYFDIPLKIIEFKLLSHCMARHEPILPDITVKELDSDCAVSDTQKANQLREKGNDAVRKQNYEDAIGLYTQAMEFVKDDPRLYNNRALSYLKLGKPEEAFNDCEICLKMEERNAKALMRKAWALYELPKTQENLKGRMRAAAAIAAYIDPKEAKKKPFQDMFSNLWFSEVPNPLQLAGSLKLSIPGATLLLNEGYYELRGTMIDKDVQLVALSKGVILKFQFLLILQCRFYAEGIVFAEESGSIMCQQKGTLGLYNCEISGGFKSCKDFPDCNGGPGCVAAELAGRNPCDRTGKFGQPGVSGVAGSPSIYVMGESTGYIENCEIRDCGGGGILCQGNGSSLTVQSCRLHHNRQAGLEARGGGRLVAIDNDIYANNFHGIMVGPQAGKCNLMSNKIFENGKEGVFILDTMDQDVRINNNRIYHNLAFGISLDRCQVEIKGNEIFENSFYGIHAKTLTTAFMENNEIYSNKCGGIQIGVNFSGRIVIKSNVVRDHSGPWLEHGDDSVSLPGSLASSDPTGNAGLFYLPKGEKGIYTRRPVVSDNDVRNNEEKAFHPKEKMQSVQNECAFCRSTKNLQRCSKCNIALYCNSSCQKRHWGKHKALCSALKDQYCVTVEPRKHLSSEGHSIRTFGPHLKGIGKGPKPNPKSKQRFIVKIQTGHLNGHPLQNLTVYDKSLSIDGVIQSPDVFHLIMECGVLGQLHKFTSKKAYFYATFADGGKKLNIYLGQLAPYQEW